MAKTSRSKKSKQEQLSEDLKIRIIAVTGLFLIVVAAMKLGPIGEQLNFLCTYILGNFVGIGYIALIIISFYVVYYAKLPRFNGPNAIGLYLLTGSILIFMSSLSEDNITGMKVVNQYIATAPCNRGGFIGAILYGMFSYLFDKTGAIIAGGFTLLISIALLGSKFYVKHNKKEKNKLKKKKGKQ